MTYEQIRVLHAIVTEGSFRAAAEKLFKSQPAVSNMIKKLEHELEIQLLSREKYRPVLTEEGAIFYEKALQVLEQMNELAGLAKRLSKHEESIVTIAVNAVCPLRTILQTLKEVQSRYIATQIKLSSEQMGGAMERLFESNADIIISTQTDIDTSIMEAKPYKTVEIIPVAHRDYPPAQSETLKSIYDMKPFVQVIVSDSSQSRSKQTMDVMPNIRRWVVTDFASKKEIILSGMGWGGLPEYMVRQELASGELVRLYVSGFDIRHSELYLIRRRDNPVGVVSQAIWQAFVGIPNG
jgi:DNA-binding transcriptional LysR family regulator